MKRKSRLRSVVLLLLLLMIFQTNVTEAQGERGVPGSSEFGFGVILHPDSPPVDSALLSAEDLHVDWLSVPLEWASYQNSPSAAPQLEPLDSIMSFASEQQISVMVSISAAPAWAKTAQGPDPAMTARFVADLVRRYPAVEAVELFPSANTTQGWGAAPQPSAYLEMFRAVQGEVENSGRTVLLIAAGLRPLASPAPSGDMDDLAFLQSLYQAGAASLMPVISIQYFEITGDPLRSIDGQERRILRHYEEVRQVMTANEHDTGQLWITRLSPPSGTIDSKDSMYVDANAQSSWMSQAYIQLRAQLYIGTAFLPALNAAPGNVEAPVPSLVSTGGTDHPFHSVLKQMIEHNQAGSISIKPGRPKDGNFGKNRP